MFISLEKKYVMIAAQEPWAFFLSFFYFVSETVLTLFVLALILIVSAREDNFRGHTLLVGNHHALG